MNPVHFPQEVVGSKTCQSYHKPIVHGMLLSTLFSTIFGTLVPGAIYRRQSLKFGHAVAVDENVTGRVIVRKLKQVNRIGSGVLCTCDTVVAIAEDRPNIDVNCKNTMMAISGEAQVWLPGATVKQHGTHI